MMVVQNVVLQNLAKGTGFNTNQAMHYKLEMHEI